MRRQKLGEVLVTKGMISPNDLRNILNEQKISKKPLGQLLIDRAVITPRQLSIILTKQYALRTCAALLLLGVSFSGGSGKKAHAEAIADVPAKLALSGITSEFSRVSVYPALYGTSEKRSANLSAFTKWTGMFERFERDLQDTRNAGVIRQWQRELQTIQYNSIKDLADKVNVMVNKVRYITDDRNWGKSDYWATPAEFIQRGGDCEDFAIAKYTALRAMGVPEERLRVMIVQDTYKNIPHAVLVVYTESGAYILDNQTKTLVPTSSGNRYQPIFSINRQAWWLHDKPSLGTQVASVN
ncbi:MAG: transglutaminase-like cysteine peptidase [Micavibrio sp.]|nr:transglutaminase-like cysteine peptidase [Micavibrio sp.]